MGTDTTQIFIDITKHVKGTRTDDGPYKGTVSVDEIQYADGKPIDILVDDDEDPGDLPSKGPVFVDNTGRRRRRVRLGAGCVGVICGSYVLIVILSLLGVPLGASGFLPSAIVDVVGIPDGEQPSRPKEIMSPYAGGQAGGQPRSSLRPPTTPTRVNAASSGPTAPVNPPATAPPAQATDQPSAVPTGNETTAAPTPPVPTGTPDTTPPAASEPPTHG